MGEKIPTRCLIANDEIFQLNFLQFQMQQHFSEVDLAVNGLDAL